MKVGMPRVTAVLAAVALTASLSACATAPTPKDYSSFRSENPKSILIVPALNNTVSVNAADYFLSTISRPFAERGYYTFPAYMVKRVLEQDGLSDAGLVHSADSSRLGGLFGCDTVLYVNIDRWDSQYIVFATTTTVKLAYTLKSCRTGASLWTDTQEIVYQPQRSSGGNPLADLVAMAIVAAIQKAAPNYIPLAQQANAQAAFMPGQGIPAGPYLPAHLHDQAVFPGR